MGSAFGRIIFFVPGACDRRDFGDFTRRMTVFRKLYDKCGYRYASYFFDGTGE